MERKEKIRRIIEDLQTNEYDSREFIWGCVRDVIENWDDDQFNDYLGIDAES